LAELEGFIGEVDVYKSLAADADEIAQYEETIVELQAEMAELLLDKDERTEALAEVERAKEQAEEAQAIATDLALGTPEALDRVVLSSQAALDVATTDLAAAITKAADLTTQLDEADAQIKFISA